jgi:hypothetical protein
VPGRDLYEVKEGSLDVLLAIAASRRVAAKLALADPAVAVAGKSARGRTKGAAAAARGPHHGHAAHATSKRTAHQAAGGTTRLASLKKRQQ